MSSQRSWRQWHTYLGIGAAAFLLITTVSGILLTFRKQLSRPEPNVPFELRDRTAIPIDQIVEKAEHVMHARVVELYFSTSSGMPHCLVFDDGNRTELYFAQNGELVDRREGNKKEFTQWVFDLHTGAWAGRVGELVMVAVASALLGSIVTGLIIWPWRLRRR